MALKRFSSFDEAMPLELGLVVGVTVYGSDEVKRLIIRELPRPLDRPERVCRVTIPAPYKVEIGDKVSDRKNYLAWTKGESGVTLIIPKLGRMLQIEGAM